MTNKVTNLFLQPVKVKAFASIRKRSTGVSGGVYHREVRTYTNPRPNDLYYVIGSTTLKSGYTIGYDEGVYFAQAKTYKVYIVAKSIGRRFKVLVEDVVPIKVQYAKDVGERV